MDWEEKTELLGTRLMGWRKDMVTPGGWDGVLGKKVVVWYHSSLYPIGERTGWKPFDDIVHAKEIQHQMRDIGFLWSAEDDGGIIKVRFEYDGEGPAPVPRAPAGESYDEAEAICEAAGLALGLWTKEG